jgi:hypothetical protein
MMNYLRKHQGYILAVLGVVLIVTWIIGPPLLEFFGSGRDYGQTRAQNVVVATWKGGELTKAQLERMRMERVAVVQFLRGVANEALQRGGQPQAPGMDSQSGFYGVPNTTDPESMVGTLLLAQRGRELGVRVDDEAVMFFLDRLGGFMLNEGDIYSIADQALENFRGQMSIRQLLDRLKEELVARQTQIMMASGLRAFSTGELWEFHAQLYQRYKIEAFPFEVADYELKVQESEATEAELRKIYEEGKDREPHPMFPDPGFRKPLRLAFGYLRADLAPFLVVAKTEIPEEKIVEEYERGVREGRFKKPQPPPASDSKSKSGETKSQDAKAGDAPSRDEQPSEPKSAEPSDGKRASKPAGADAPDQGKEKAKQEEPPEKSKREDCQAEDPKSQPAKESEPEEAKPAPSSETTPPANAKGGREKPGEPAEGGKSQPSEGQKTTDGDNASGQPMPQAEEVLPLSQVRDEILTRLAEPAAVKARDAALRSAMKEIREFGAKYNAWQRNKKDPTRTIAAKDPGELKINTIAKKYNLTAGKTGLMDRFQADKHPELGQQAIALGIQGSVPFAQVAYADPREDLYSPKELDSLFRDTKFIYWRTEVEPGSETPYDKARPQVLEIWRSRKALELAKKDAAALAEKAAEAGSLKDVLPQDQAKKLIEPPEFSWLTKPSTLLIFGGTPQLSTVGGIPMAGEEFMKSVFALEVGQTGVAVNQPHTTVYAVRVVSEAPPVDIRREMFLSSLQQGVFGDLAAFAFQEQQRLAGRLFEDLYKQYDLKWVNVAALAEEDS